jgi:hypothetical protein
MHQARGDCVRWVMSAILVCKCRVLDFTDFHLMKDKKFQASLQVFNLREAFMEATEVFIF